ncbi:unnamed protein product [Phytophthora fragariaefolia]|uniref:Unnamed protein product n=1 Tax=Phytophthora fragariaefolia TaxID=1490495 RepID=A0A9W6X3A4_9STRA|nr:unnamed protein product [Phytophthora fragariaefolia]
MTHFEPQRCGLSFMDVLVGLRLFCDGNPSSSIAICEPSTYPSLDVYSSVANTDLIFKALSVSAVIGKVDKTGDFAESIPTHDASKRANRENPNPSSIPMLVHLLARVQRIS